MILCIPYNPSLPGGYDKLVSGIVRYGKHPAHTLFIVAKAEHEEGAFTMAMQLKDHFSRYFAITVPDQPEAPIRNSNRMFVAAMDALRSYKPLALEMPQPVMLYFDPSWRPTQDRWLDKFQAEYYISGAPTTFGSFKTTGTAKVIGPVAISCKFLRETKLLNFLPETVHWREFLAWEIINSGLQAEALGRILPAYIRPFTS